MPTAASTKKKASVVSLDVICPHGGTNVKRFCQSCGNRRQDVYHCDIYEECVKTPLSGKNKGVQACSNCEHHPSRLVPPAQDLSYVPIVPQFVLANSNAYQLAKDRDLPVAEAILDLDRPERPRANNWHRLDSIVAAHVEGLKAFADNCPSYPEGHFSGRGAVLLGGGRYEPGLYVAIHMLRRVGWNHPVSVYHRGNSEPISDKIRSLPGVIVQDILPLVRLTKRRSEGGWQTKMFAIIHSPYEEVLFLDADAYPILSPEAVPPENPLNPHLKPIDCFDLLEDGLMVWRDVPAGNRHLKWGAYRREPDNRPPLNGGHYLVRKRDAWKILNVAAWIDDHSDYFYRWQHGDQDSVRAALAVCGKEGDRVHFNPEIKGGCYLQPTPDGQHTLFVHRHHSKFGEIGWFPATCRYNDELPMEAAAFAHYGDWKGLPVAGDYSAAPKIETHALLEGRTGRHIVVVNANDFWPPNAKASVKAAARRWGANVWELDPLPSPLVPSYHRNLTALGMFPEDQLLVLDGDCLIRSDAPDPFAMIAARPEGIFGARDNVSERFTPERRAEVREMVKRRWAKKIASKLGVGYDEVNEDDFINGGMILRNPSPDIDEIAKRIAEITALFPEEWGNAHFEQAILNWTLLESPYSHLGFLDECWNMIGPNVGLPVIDAFICHFTGWPDGSGINKRDAIEAANWRKE